MSSYICPMYDYKEWTREQLIELCALARKKGITKGVLAEKWLGVHPTTLSYWMSKSDSYREPTDMARRLLTFVEDEIKKREDVR